MPGTANIKQCKTMKIVIGTLAALLGAVSLYSIQTPVQAHPEEQCGWRFINTSEEMITYHTGTGEAYYFVGAAALGDALDGGSLQEAIQKAWLRIR